MATISTNTNARHFWQRWDVSNLFIPKVVLLVSVGFAANIYGADLQESLSVDQRMNRQAKTETKSGLFSTCSENLRK